MLKKKSWAVVLAVLALTACEGEFQNSSEADEGSGTGGDATTDEGVVLALGSGSGGSFQSGKLTLAASNLSAGGETQVTVNLVDTEQNNALYQGVPLEVEFNSGCVADEKAEFSSPSIITSGGVAQTTFRAMGCVGEDTITARVDTAIASAQVTVAPADVGAIGFESVSDPSISYNGFWVEGLPSVASVTFVLRDGSGNVVVGQSASFSLTSSIQGSGQPQLVNTTATSDDQGRVIARVRAGTLGTSVRVIARHTTSGGQTIETTSSPIAVNTGPPDYESFSIHSDNFAPEAYNRVEPISVTVHASDKNKNPVADGTPISFWTEYGQIDASCLTSEGRCTVEWNSSGKRPDSGPAQLPSDGLTTIHAWTAGEDTFHDSETIGIDGLYDSTDTLVSTPERFYDRNFDLAYNNDGSEEYVDYDGSGDYTASSTMFRGYSCSSGAIGVGHCAQGVEVWDQMQVVMATSGLTITPLASANLNDPLTEINGGGVYYFSLQDSFGHQAPTGTSIEVTANNGEVDSSVSLVSDGGRLTPDIFSFVYEEGDEGPIVGLLTIKATTPSGLVNAYSMVARYFTDPITITTSSTSIVGGAGSVDIELSRASGNPIADNTSLTVATTKGTATFDGGVETDYVINGDLTFTVNYTSNNAAPTRGFITVVVTSPDGEGGTVRIEVRD